MAQMNDGPGFTPDREGREKSSIQLPLKFCSISVILQPQQEARDQSEVSSLMGFNS